MDGLKLQISAERKSIFKCIVIFSINCVLYTALLGMFYNSVPGFTLVLFGFVALLMFWFSIYCVRLYLEIGPILNFDKGSIFDAASILDLGLLREEDIYDLKIIRKFSFSYFAITLSKRATVFSSMSFGKRFLYDLHSLVFNRTIYIPMFFLNTTEAQLRKYFWARSRVIRDKSADAGKPFSPNIDEKVAEKKKFVSYRIDRAMDKIYGVKKEEEKKAKEKKKAKKKGILKKLALPPIPKTEKEKVMEKIQIIKASIKEAGVDALLVELFYDHIRNFPKWEKKKDPRLPKRVKSIRHLEDTNKLEVIEFDLRGFTYRFKFKKMARKGDTGELSIYMDQKIQAKFLGQVEIGTLDVKDISRFVQGRWADDLAELYHELTEDNIFKAKMQIDFGFDEDITEITEVSELSESSEEDEDELERLKNRFGL